MSSTRDRRTARSSGDEGRRGDAAGEPAVADLFARALELAPEQRAELLALEAAALPEVVREVESLLAAHGAAEGFLETGLDGAKASRLVGESVLGWVPERIGPYRLLGELGRGGMGAVFLAQRDDDAFRKEVAIKVVAGSRTTPELARRFRIERQALAGFEHPNVARLLDGGTTDDGLPFVVMERIVGEPIDQYCESRGLGVEERVRLVLALCEAVAAAHRSLVIHRDIKPANVLVTGDGVPKLLDFGIAKLLGSDAEDPTVEVTRTAHRRLTPAYASPEQVRGEAITTATDVYALGALLYRLLAGRPPVDVATSSAVGLDRAHDAEPPPPRSGRRDLDTIVQKALRREPDRRYSTVPELREDLQRFLDGRPILARPATLGYRASRFLQRHRRAVAATTGVLVLLVAGAAWSTLRLAAERDLARAEAEKASRVTELLVGLFRGASPRAGGREMSIREVLEAGARRLRAELRDQPEIRAELLRSIGRVRLELGHLEEAEALAAESLEVSRALSGDDGPKATDARELLAEVAIAAADYDRAGELLERVLTVRRAAEGPQGEATAHSLYLSGLLATQRSEDAEARRIFEEVLELREGLHGPDAPTVAQVLSSLAISARRLDRTDEAEAFYRRAIAIYEQAHPEHPDLAAVLNNLGVLLSRTERPKEAVELYRQALAVHEGAWGGEHPLVAGTLGNLAEALMHQGRLEEALPLARRALAIQEAALGGRHRDVGTGLNLEATILRELGRHEEAIAAYQRAIEVYEASLGEGHFWTAWPVANLGDLHRQLGEAERARTYYRRALDLREVALGPDHSQVAFSLEDLARLEREVGELAEAARLLERASEIRRALPGREGLAGVLEELAVVLRDAGRGEEAVAIEAERAGIGGPAGSAAAPP